MWARGQSCFVCLMFLLLLRSVSSYLELLWLNSVELAAPYRQVSVYPRGPETAEPSVHEKCLCCQLWFPAWPLLLGCPTRPHRGPPWPFVCGPCSLWTSRSLAFHMRLCPITPCPPLNIRSLCLHLQPVADPERERLSLESWIPAWRKINHLWKKDEGKKKRKSR